MNAGGACSILGPLGDMLSGGFDRDRGAAPASVSTEAGSSWLLSEGSTLSTLPLETRGVASTVRSIAELSERRRAAIEAAFRRVDSMRRGYITAQDAASALQRLSHLSPEDQRRVMRGLSERTDIITFSRFSAYYENIGSCLERDCDFEDLVRQHWGFPEVADILNDMKNKFLMVGVAYTFRDAIDNGTPLEFTMESFQAAIGRVGISYHAADMQRLFNAFNPDEPCQVLEVARLGSHLASAARPQTPVHRRASLPPESTLALQCSASAASGGIHPTSWHRSCPLAPPEWGTTADGDSLKLPPPMAPPEEEDSKASLAPPEAGFSPEPMPLAPEEEDDPSPPEDLEDGSDVEAPLEGVGNQVWHSAASVYKPPSAAQDMGATFWPNASASTRLDAARPAAGWAPCAEVDELQLPPPLAPVEEDDEGALAPPEKECGPLGYGAMPEAPLEDDEGELLPDESWDTDAQQVPLESPGQPGSMVVPPRPKVPSIQGFHVADQLARPPQAPPVKVGSSLNSAAGPPPLAPTEEEDSGLTAPPEPGFGESLPMPAAPPESDEGEPLPEECMGNPQDDDAALDAPSEHVGVPVGAPGAAAWSTNTSGQPAQLAAPPEAPPEKPDPTLSSAVSPPPLAPAEDDGGVVAPPEPGFVSCLPMPEAPPEDEEGEPLPEETMGNPQEDDAAQFAPSEHLGWNGAAAGPVRPQAQGQKERPWAETAARPPEAPPEGASSGLPFPPMAPSEEDEGGAAAPPEPGFVEALPMPVAPPEEEEEDVLPEESCSNPDDDKEVPQEAVNGGMSFTNSSFWNHPAAVVSPSGSAGPSAQSCKRAVTVGINYVGHARSLDGGIGSSDAFIRLLRSEVGFKVTDIRQLRDDHPSRMPTRKNIIAALKWLVRGANAGDHLLFHYSGYSGAECEGLCSWSGGKRGESVVPCDYQQSGMISSDDLRQLIVQPLPKGVRLTVVLDCNLTGALLGLSYRVTPRHDGSLQVNGGQAGSAVPHPSANVVAMAVDTNAQQNAGRTTAALKAIINRQFDVAHHQVLAEAMRLAASQGLHEVPQLYFEQFPDLLECFLPEAAAAPVA